MFLKKKVTKLLELPRTPLVAERSGALVDSCLGSDKKVRGQDSDGRVNGGKGPGC